MTDRRGFARGLVGGVLGLFGLGRATQRVRPAEPPRGGDAPDQSPRGYLNINWDGTLTVVEMDEESVRKELEAYRNGLFPRYEV